MLPRGCDAAVPSGASFAPSEGGHADSRPVAVAVAMGETVRPQRQGFLLSNKVLHRVQLRPPAPSLPVRLCKPPPPPQPPPLPQRSHPPRPGSACSTSTRALCTGGSGLLRGLGCPGRGRRLSNILKVNLDPPDATSHTQAMTNGSPTAPPSVSPHNPCSSSPLLSSHWPQGGEGARLHHHRQDRPQGPLDLVKRGSRTPSRRAQRRRRPLQSARPQPHSNFRFCCFKNR